MPGEISWALQRESIFLTRFLLLCRGPLKKTDLIGPIIQNRWIVGGPNHGKISRLALPCDQELHPFNAAGIEPGKGIIKEKDLRFTGKHCRKSDQMLLPVTEQVRRALLQMGNAKCLQKKHHSILQHLAFKRPPPSAKGHFVKDRSFKELFLGILIEHGQSSAKRSQ